jgi:hypothetical protein
MHKDVIVLAILLSCASAASARAATWADQTDPAYAESVSICKKVPGLQLPALPSSVKSDPSCDPEALYYGIGRSADPKAARLCALTHIATADDAASDPFDGPGILATIYANGAGVPRDLDIAIGFACQIDGALAETDRRVLHLAKLKSEPNANKAFDICDDAASRMLAGQCAARNAELAKGKTEGGGGRLH